MITDRDIEANAIIGAAMLHLQEHPEKRESWLRCVGQLAGPERREEWQAWFDAGCPSPEDQTKA